WDFVRAAHDAESKAWDKYQQVISDGLIGDGNNDDPDHAEQNYHNDYNQAEVTLYGQLRGLMDNLRQRYETEGADLVPLAVVRAPSYMQNPADPPVVT